MKKRTCIILLAVYFIFALAFTIIFPHIYIKYIDSYFHKKYLNTSKIATSITTPTYEIQIDNKSPPKNYPECQEFSSSMVDQIHNVMRGYTTQSVEKLPHKIYQKICVYLNSSPEFLKQFLKIFKDTQYMCKFSDIWHVFLYKYNKISPLIRIYFHGKTSDSLTFTYCTYEDDSGKTILYP